MRPLSRRRALQLGGVGVAGVVVGGAGSAWAGTTRLSSYLCLILDHHNDMMGVIEVV